MLSCGAKVSANKTKTLAQDHLDIYLMVLVWLFVVVVIIINFIVMLLYIFLIFDIVSLSTLSIIPNKLQIVRIPPSPPIYKMAEVVIECCCLVQRTKIILKKKVK